MPGASSRRKPVDVEPLETMMAVHGQIGHAETDGIVNTDQDVL
jgi:hypothetical protein